MLHEYRDVITILRQKDAHFAKIFEKHNELDDRIIAIEEGRESMDRLEVEALKKEKLALKDKAYAMILKYKKENPA